MLASSVASLASFRNAGKTPQDNWLLIKMLWVRWCRAGLLVGIGELG
jgi:hypothetical protein